MEYRLILIVSYSIDVDLIPRSSVDGCPKDTIYKAGVGSCSCEDHCGWDVCRLIDAPLECIIGTNSEWQWDYVKSAWVAQISQGNISSISIAILTIIIPHNFYHYSTSFVRCNFNLITYLFSKAHINTFGVVRTFISRDIAVIPKKGKDVSRAISALIAHLESVYS